MLDGWVVQVGQPDPTNVRDNCYVVTLHGSCGRGIYFSFNFPNVPNHCYINSHLTQKIVRIKNSIEKFFFSLLLCSNPRPLSNPSAKAFILWLRLRFSFVISFRPYMWSNIRLFHYLILCWIRAYGWICFIKLWILYDNWLL